MNAELRVPSPNILRKRLGIVKARMKASPKIDVPKAEKNSISRSRPRILEPIVSKLTKDKFFAILLIPAGNPFSIRTGQGLPSQH